jgi:two-component system nitrate/nitrite response regulator NarL
VSAPEGLEGLGVSLDAVLRQLPAAVAIVDASGRIVYSNPLALDLVERRLARSMPDEVSGGFDIFYLDGRRYDRAEWPVVRSIATGETVVDEEYFHVLPDGSRMIVRASSCALYSDATRIAGGALVMLDVTGEKQVEEQLAHHRSLLDNVDDAVVTMDGGWHLNGWNAGAERMYGWSAAEVLGRHVTEVARLELSHEQRKVVRDTTEEQGRWRGEVVAFRKDGSTVAVELITVALRDGAGALTGFVSIHRDVSERRRARQALEESHERLRTILEGISDGFVAVDAEWRYTYMNDRALDRMRVRSGNPALTRDDLLGRSMWEVFPDALASELHDRYTQAMRDRTSVEFETYFAPSGAWIEARADPSGSGLAIHYRDVTARRQAAADRERSAYQQALVADFGLRALASHDEQALMDDAVALVSDTLGTELSAIVELLPGGNSLLLRAGVGWHNGSVGTSPAKLGRHSLVGYTLLAREPIVSADFEADERFPVSPFLTAHGARSGITVVIEGRDAPVGALGAFSDQPRVYNPDDVNFLQAIANVLATAVERTQAEERLLQVRDAERRRIARDLHDEALAHLTVLLAEASLAPDLPAERLVGPLKRVGEQLRAAIYDLRLTGSEERTFPELLAELVRVHQAIADRTRIVLELDEGIPTTSLGARGTDVLRILGEALTNARRHAAADRVHVRAWGSRGRLGVEVVDDGAGFDPVAQPPAGAAGIAGMHERAALLYGRLDIVSSPGAGTRVRLEMDLNDEAPSGETLRVLLVDDHAAVRQAIAAALEREAGFTVVGQAGSLAEARELLEGVDVAVIDLGLPDGYGADLIPELRHFNRRAQALVLTSTLDRTELARAVDRGAACALDKVAHLDDVVDAVRRLWAGETLLPLDEVLELMRHAARDRAREHDDRQAIARLTRREREVLQALAEGLDSEAMAQRFHISIRTQRNHIANVLSKLGVHSQLQALVFALRYDLVQVRASRS